MTSYDMVIMHNGRTPKVSFQYRLRDTMCRCMSRRLLMYCFPWKEVSIGPARQFRPASLALYIISLWSTSLLQCKGTSRFYSFVFCPSVWFMYPFLFIFSGTQSSTLLFPLFSFLFMSFRRCVIYNTTICYSNI